MLTCLETCPGFPVPGEGVCFRMREIRRTVRFFASTALLRRVTGRAVTDELAAFQSVRADIEALARLAHAAWPYDDDSVIELDASHFSGRARAAVTVPHRGVVTTGIAAAA